MPALADEIVPVFPSTDRDLGEYDPAVCYDWQSGSERVKSSMDILSKCGIFIFDECVAGLKYVTKFELLTDANANGETENISIVSSSNECLNESVENSVLKWIFDTKGEAVAGISLKIRLYGHGDQEEKSRVFESFRNY